MSSMNIMNNCKRLLENIVLCQGRQRIDILSKLITNNTTVQPTSLNTSMHLYFDVNFTYSFIKIKSAIDPLPPSDGVAFNYVLKANQAIANDVGHEKTKKRHFSLI